MRPLFIVSVIFFFQSVGSAALECGGFVEVNGKSLEVPMSEVAEGFFMAEQEEYKFLVMTGPDTLALSIDRYDNKVLIFGTSTMTSIPKSGASVTLWGSDPGKKSKVNITCINH